MKIKKNIKVYLPGLLAIIAFFVLWELVSRLKLITPLFISSPWEIIREVFEFFVSGTIYDHLLISGQEFTIGFFIALFWGVSLGILIGWYKKFSGITNPFIYGLYATPSIAILPLIIIWLGIDIWPKVAIVFLSAFFPILINTIEGVKNLNPEFVKLGRSLGARDRDIFTKIALPGSMPFILTGIKLAVGRGIIGMLVGEFFVSNKGLGYLINFYGSTFQTGKLLAVVLIVVIISILLTRMVELVQHRFTVH